MDCGSSALALGSGVCCYRQSVRIDGGGGQNGRDTIQLFRWNLFRVYVPGTEPCTIWTSVCVWGGVRNRWMGTLYS